MCKSEIYLNTQGPLVSIIIPTYKRSEMLPRAIESVLNQTYKNIQVIVVDDNDPDTEFRIATEQRMLLYNYNPRVKYIRHEKNMNGSVARNTGIKNADGEIVAFLDDDDWYLPEKIEKQVEYLLAHTEFHAVYCGWNRDGCVVIPTEMGDLSYNILSGDHLIYTNVIMMWKQDAVACGGWDETFMRHQEAAFMLRYFRGGGRIGVVSKSLVEFDVSDRSNVAGNPKKNEEQTMHYLNSYRDILEQCEKEKTGPKKKILLHRYRGMFLGYLKEKDYLGTFSFWCRYCKTVPISFACCLMKYVFTRNVGKS